MVNTYFAPYKAGSKGLKNICDYINENFDEVNAKRLKVKGSKYKQRQGHLLINWGGGHNCPLVDKLHANGPACVLNLTGNGTEASNKRSFFEKMQQSAISIPRVAYSKDAAEEMLGECDMIVARHVLQGHSGEGIELIDDPDKITEAPLYTEYVRKKWEFRVHIVDHQILGDSLTTMKVRRRDVPDEKVNWQVRNFDNGFTYGLDKLDEVDHKLRQRISEAALETIRHLGLDFGAVDIIYNELRDKLYVLEVNTAPGCEGRTAEFYGAVFANLAMDRN